MPTDSPSSIQYAASSAVVRSSADTATSAASPPTVSTALLGRTPDALEGTGGDAAHREALGSRR
jgi:hypothetical protein